MNKFLLVSALTISFVAGTQMNAADNTPSREEMRRLAVEAAERRQAAQAQAEPVALERSFKFPGGLVRKVINPTAEQVARMINEGNAVEITAAKQDEKKAAPKKPVAKKTAPKPVAKKPVVHSDDEDDMLPPAPQQRPMRLVDGDDAPENDRLSSARLVADMATRLGFIIEGRSLEGREREDNNLRPVLYHLGAALGVTKLGLADLELHELMQIEENLVPSLIERLTDFMGAIQRTENCIGNADEYDVAFAQEVSIADLLLKKLPLPVPQLEAAKAESSEDEKEAPVAPVRGRGKKVAAKPTAKPADRKRKR